MSSEAKTLLPDNLAIYDMNSYGGVVSRKSGYVPAQPQSGYQPGNKIMFSLPMEFMDLRKATFQFTVQGTPGAGATYTRFNVDMRSVINRIIIQFGSRTVYDCQGQNLLFNITNNTHLSTWASTSGVITNGTGSTVQRNADFLNANRVYAVELYNLPNSELLSYPLPLHKLGSQVYVTLYLADPSTCIESDGTAPTYVLNNCQWHYDSLTPSEGWNSMYNDQIPRGVAYNYLNFEQMFDSSILTAGTTQASKTLTFRYSSFLGIIAVMRPLASINSLTANNKLSTFNLNSLNVAQLRIGTFTQPIDQARSPADLYLMFCQLFNKSAYDPLAAAVNFDSSNFVLAINLAKHPHQKIDQNTSISGINTSISNSLILDLGFSTPLPANYTLEVYGISECSVIFQPNGSITWEN